MSVWMDSVDEEGMNYVLALATPRGFRVVIDPGVIPSDCGY